ncbi:MAG TPA: ABC transporter substrate-binding protein [Candidatus Dormibacteraeota bacterium]|nr:ABC transporter substrate-binding protein [Candidatus Dormibacteraeota bacterium]
MPAKGEVIRRHSLVLFFVCIVVVIALWGSDRVARSSPTTVNTLSLALDWTPNTNHTGIYVALSKGWYKDAGLNLKVLPYSSSVTPDQLVAAGKADLGISSTEQVVADAGAAAPVVSIAAIVAHNTSVLAVTKASGITSPKQLDGKIYGGFGSPFETPEISAVLRHAGGTGNFVNVTLGVDPIEALRTNQVNFVWVFSGWEVIQARLEGLALTTFPISNYGVPDYSTPNIISSATTITSKSALIQKFMDATVRGYDYARSYPAQAAQILLGSVPPGTFPNPNLVKQSQAYLSSHYQDPGKPWGVQTAASWQNYTTFMLNNHGVFDASGRAITALNAKTLYTNKFL